MDHPVITANIDVPAIGRDLDGVDTGLEIHDIKSPYYFILVDDLDFVVPTAYKQVPFKRQIKSADVEFVDVADSLFDPFIV